MYNTENWYHLLWNKLFKTHNYYEVLRGNSHINKFNIIIIILGSLSQTILDYKKKMFFFSPSKYQKVSMPFSISAY